MNMVLEFFEIVIAIGIIVFSIIGVYYNVRAFYYHYLEQGRLKNCCYITLLRILTLAPLSGVFMYIVIQTVFLGNNIVEVKDFGALFIRPLILMLSVLTTIASKERYILIKNIRRIRKHQ